MVNILDEDDTRIPKVNKEIVKIQRVVAPVAKCSLRALLKLMLKKLGAAKAPTFNEWEKYLPLFWLLVPPSEEDTPEACADYEQTSTGQVTLQSV